MANPVDDLQNAEEFVNQMREEQERAATEALHAELVGMEQTHLAELDVETRFIPISEIEKGFNIRSELRNIEALARSIRVNGLQTALKVREREDGGYLLVAGERRLEALKLIDQATGDGDGSLQARCEVVNDSATEGDHFLAQVIENDREELEPKDWARGIRVIMREHPDWTAQQVADKLGKSRSFVQKHLRLLDGLPAPVLDRLEAGDLSFTTADLLRKGVKSGEISEAEAEQLAEQLADGQISPGEVKEKAQPKMHEAPENYDELSRQLDEARFEQLYGSKEEKAASDALEDAADAILSGAGPAPWEDSGPAASADPAAELVYSSADRENLNPGDRADWADEISDHLADAYLLGLLLSRYMNDDYLDELGTSRPDVYSYAVELEEGERRRMLRELSRTILAASPAPPRTILKAAGVQK